MSDRLCKALAFGDEVSLSVLECTELVQNAIDIHKLSDEEGELLGGLLVGCAYMAGCLGSDEGAVSITVKSRDGSATASVSGDAFGHIRGYVDGTHLKGGTMTVIKEDGFFRPFNGVCELKSDDVAENLMNYYQKSEQIDTAVYIKVDVRGGVCSRAVGVVEQLLPGTGEKGAEKAENTMQAIAANDPRFSEDILDTYFPDEKKTMFVTRPVYRCNCSREKIESVIASLGKKEAYDILRDYGKISVHCHYCEKDYNFYSKDVEKIFRG